MEIWLTDRVVSSEGRLARMTITRYPVGMEKSRVWQSVVSSKATHSSSREDEAQQARVRRFVIVTRLKSMNDRRPNFANNLIYLKKNFS